MKEESGIILTLPSQYCCLWNAAQSSHLYSPK